MEREERRNEKRREESEETERERGVYTFSQFNYNFT